jgi:hypothetical protein
MKIIAAETTGLHIAALEKTASRERYLQFISLQTQD